MAKNERWDLYHGPYSLPKFLDEVLDKGLTVDQLSSTLIEDWLPNFHEIDTIDTNSLAYQVGHEAGFEEGWDEGHVDADVDGAYEDGSAEGYSQGHDDGYKEGYADAREEFEV